MTPTRSLTVDDLLRDRKQSSSAFENLLRFYAADDDLFPHCKRLEAKAYNQEIYRALGWGNEDHYTMLTPLWKILECALVSTCEIENLTCSALCCPELDAKNWSYPPFCFQNDSFMVFFSKQGDLAYHRTEKSTLARKLLDAETVYAKVAARMLEIFPQLQELASLFHTVANFSPCPSPEFARGQRVHPRIAGFYSLLIDLVADSCRNRSALAFEHEKENVFENWNKFLMMNREKLCLEDYYFVEGEQIKSIPLFDGQSLVNPLPRTRDEITQCLDEMVRRIRRRAERLYEKQKDFTA